MKIPINHPSQHPLRDEQVCDPRALPIGAHLLTPRAGYTHHGIYIGDGRVVHYAGSSRLLQNGPVEEVSIESFTHGRPLKLRRHRRSRFTGVEVVERARSRLDENLYDMLNNNCEHFCEWCARDSSSSRQVDRWLKLPQRIATAFNHLFELPILHPLSLRS